MGIVRVPSFCFQQTCAAHRGDGVAIPATTPYGMAFRKSTENPINQSICLQTQRYLFQLLQLLRLGLLIQRGELVLSFGDLANVGTCGWWGQWGKIFVIECGTCPAWAWRRGTRLHAAAHHASIPRRPPTRTGFLAKPRLVAWPQRRPQRACLGDAAWPCLAQLRGIDLRDMGARRVSGAGAAEAGGKCKGRKLGPLGLDNNPTVPL